MHTTPVPYAPTCCYHGDQQSWLQCKHTLAYDHIMTNMVDTIDGYPVLVRDPNGNGEYHADHLPVIATLRTPSKLTPLWIGWWKYKEWLGVRV